MSTKKTATAQAKKNGKTAKARELEPTVRCAACGDSQDAGDGTPCPRCCGAKKKTRVVVYEPQEPTGPALKARRPVPQAKTPSTDASATDKPAKGANGRPQTPAKRPAAAKTAKDANPPQDAPRGKLTALDAAAQILGGAPEPLTTKQLVEAMAAQGLWSSPGGKTPHATLHSAICREIATKGREARFRKADRGKFAAANA